MRGAVANGPKIVALRTAAGLTQEQLAVDAQCDPKTLRSAERSKRADISTLRRIAGCLGMHFRDIVEETPDDLRASNIAAAESYIRAFNAILMPWPSAFTKTVWSS
jgi:transcriptional regulator with XRE-family HTH domain